MRSQVLYRAAKDQSDKFIDAAPHCLMVSAVQSFFVERPALHHVPDWGEGNSSKPVIDRQLYVMRAIRARRLCTCTACM